MSSPAEISYSSLYNSPLQEYEAASTVTSQHYVSAISSSREAPGLTSPYYDPQLHVITYDRETPLLNSSYYDPQIHLESSTRETSGLRDCSPYYSAQPPILDSQLQVESADLRPSTSRRVSVETQTGPGDDRQLFRQRTNTCPDKRSPQVQRTRTSHSYDRELPSQTRQTLYKPTSLEDFKKLIQYNRKSASKSVLNSTDKRFSVIQEEPDQSERPDSVCVGGTLV